MNKVIPVRFGSNTTPSLELSVLGYQYPDLPDADYDSNWLVIQVKVDHPLGNYHRTAPIYLTREVKDLIDWFTALATDHPVRAYMGGMEPTLWFLHHPSDEERIKLSINLDVEFHPPWVEYPVDDEDYQGVPIEVSHSKRELIQIANNLREQLAKFPPRAGW